ncbi:MAG: GNAT family N-acetyltransferase [Defluviitaleaceae bacterium]|nr:GNAT family N-acetyltransferase [Defluviitaleaceae bacterium]
MIKLEAVRLTIRPYKEADLPEYFALLSDKVNMYYLDDIITETEEDARQSLAEAIALMENGQARRFAFTLKGSDKLIGSVGYDVTETTPLGRIGHMGWFVLPEHQGKGYVTEAAMRVLEYAFSEDNCIRITTGCYAENIPTQKVMSKVGFRHEGTRIKAAFHDGKMKDRLEYAINYEAT